MCLQWECLKWVDPLKLCTLCMGSLCCLIRASRHSASPWKSVRILITIGFTDILLCTALGCMTFKFLLAQQVYNSNSVCSIGSWYIWGNRMSQMSHWSMKWDGKSVLPLFCCSSKIIFTHLLPEIRTIWDVPSLDFNSSFWLVFLPT